MPLLLFLLLQFLCAIPPSTRQKWAKKMRQLFRTHVGELVTLIFPVNGDPDKPLSSLNNTNGPPFEVTPLLYSHLLREAGFACAYLAPTSDSIQPRLGREWLGRWRPV